MSRRFWTQDENEYLIKAYKHEPIQVVASSLDRSIRAVYGQARKLGLHAARDLDELKQRKVKIRRLIKQGLSDSEVAAKLGMDRRALCEMRLAMGLPANGRNERYRRRVALKTKQQCRAAGVKNLAEIRSKRFRELAEALGWPGLSVRAAQIAEALHRLGPMTRKQICEAIGIPWKGSRKSLSTNRVRGGSYMAELQRAGVVVRLQSAITHRGKGNHEDLYMIGLEVEPCKKAR